ncbi:MAG: class I SAM-dependent methyltransferase [Solirubrobacteraceae bacterium]
MSLQVPGSAAEPADLIAADIAALAPWYHNLHLPSGHQTAATHPLGDFPAFQWVQIAEILPDDLTGVRALDIGCNAGYCSFELAGRGAEVLAVDVDEHYLRQARWAAPQLDPAGQVTFVRMHLYDLITCAARFDLILFLGVLYHLRYPQLALDVLAPLVGGQMIVQTLTMPGSPPIEIPDDLPFEARARTAEPGWPKAAFIEQSLAGDRSNWWAPDDACVRAMLRSAGLRVIGSPAHEVFVCEPEREKDPDWALRRAEVNAAMFRRRGSGARDLPGWARR